MSTIFTWNTEHSIFPSHEFCIKPLFFSSYMCSIFSVCLLFFLKYILIVPSPKPHGFPKFERLKFQAVRLGELSAGLREEFEGCLLDLEKARLVTLHCGTKVTRHLEIVWNRCFFNGKGRKNWWITWCWVVSCCFSHVLWYNQLQMIICFFLKRSENSAICYHQLDFFQCCVSCRMIFSQNLLELGKNHVKT